MGGAQDRNESRDEPRPEVVTDLDRLEASAPRAPVDGDGRTAAHEHRLGVGGQRDEVGEDPREALVDARRRRPGAYDASGLEASSAGLEELYGVHVAAARAARAQRVGFDHVVEPSLVLESAAVVVEDEDQARIVQAAIGRAGGIAI